MKPYRQFLEDKILEVSNTGFKVDEALLHPSNLPHQRDLVLWAARGGCRAIFAQFGLGKTQIQLEIARLCLLHHPGHKALIICPLGVKQEFKKDAKRLGIHIQYCRTNQEIQASNTDIIITNYERVRDGDIDPNQFILASLDEASVLRSFGSKTYQTFLSLFEGVRYKYVCTATPSPNRYKELIHYAGFLGIMDTGQALTRFFQRDSTKANNLTLYPHKEREFWLWVSSWATFLTKPSDLGYSDEGYDLTPLRVHYHLVDNGNEELKLDDRNQFKAFHDTVIDLKSSAREKRKSIESRLEKAKEILDNEDPGKHWLIWHHLEDERKALEKAIECQSVYGSQKEDLKEQRLIGFAEGEYRILATKQEIAGSGCNFQQYCHSNIFMGINYKFNGFIQAIHRTHRFQQKHPVEVHIIYTKNEEPVIKILQAKWKRHDELMQQMTEIIKEYGLNQSLSEMKRTIGIKRIEKKGQNFTVVNNDCVEETHCMKKNSIDLICTSIPFSNHYEYTPSYNDFGHTDDDDHFFAQMDYLTPELYRVLRPGRVAAIHVKDRILFGNATGLGMPSVNPFHAKTIFHFTKHGFVFFGMITIETDVVRENNQTYRLGWSEQCKDGTKMGVGSPEYLLLFRKLPTDTSKAYADLPVSKDKEDYSRGRWQIDARAKWNSSGDRLITPGEIKKLPLEHLDKRFKEYASQHVYDYDSHVEVSAYLENEGKLPATFETLKVPARYDYVWSDINRMHTLNSKQQQKREQNHICPLQVDIVDRVINRYSNEGDQVFDPFGGLMTVPYRAIHLNRKGYGVELNSEYFESGYRYCRDAEALKNIPTLFDVL